MLKLTDLTVGYGDILATHGINLEVKAGHVSALIGANGAGKSSTLMAIAGHVKVMSGTIEFEGLDITTSPISDRVRKGIAISPEGRRLFPDLTIFENLTIGGYSQPKEKEQKNRETVLDLFPRLGERLYQRAGNLSGGEQQMLAIGRALMSEPTFLIIDELSLGLMPKAVDICYQAISRLKKEGITVLLVEQSTRRAFETADDVCVLESGNMVWSGPATEAKNELEMIETLMGFRE